MARKKCTKLKEMSEVLAKAIGDIPEINSQNIEVQDGGVISLRVDGRPCKIKFSIEHQSKKSQTQDVMLDLQ